MTTAKGLLCGATSGHGICPAGAGAYGDPLLDVPLVGTTGSDLKPATRCAGYGGPGRDSCAGQGQRLSVAGPGQVSSLNAHLLLTFTQSPSPNDYTSAVCLSTHFPLSQSEPLTGLCSPEPRRPPRAFCMVVRGTCQHAHWSNPRGKKLGGSSLLLSG